MAASIVAPANTGEPLLLAWPLERSFGQQPPSARGFGGTVVAHIAARDLGGTARPAFRPQGVSRTLEAPLDRRAA